jgi:hypothetical protein
MGHRDRITAVMTFPEDDMLVADRDAIHQRKHTRYLQLKGNLGHNFEQEAGSLQIGIGIYESKNI